jgi:hypothetical protein
MMQKVRGPEGFIDIFQSSKKGTQVACELFNPHPVIFVLRNRRLGPAGTADPVGYNFGLNRKRNNSAD